MPYTGNPTWADGSGGGTPITAATLEVIEAGILAAIPKDLVDAAGDLLVGTAADTVGRLAKGTALQYLRVNAAATALEYATLASASAELAYTAFTSNVSVTATTEGTANTVVGPTSGVTFDGSTIALIEFYCPNYSHSADSLATILLYEDSTLLGQIHQFKPGAATGNANGAIHTVLRRTPSAASHTYTVKALVASGTLTISAGTGGTGAFVAGCVRVSRA